MKTFQFPLWRTIGVVFLSAAGYSDAATLKEPSSVSSFNNGCLDTSLALEMGKFSVNGATYSAPLFNGTLPGPTIRLRAGDNLQITFFNQLPDEGTPYKHNQYSAPAESNLHFHGLFVSGELPSDDTSVVVGPGESFQYTIQIPKQHLPGTHWLHPHRHGSTAFQVGGGAAAAVIVEDPVGFLPSPVEDAKDILLLSQEINPRESSEVVSISQGSNLLNSDTTSDNRVIVVNGQVRPSIPINAGEWNRLRIINAGWAGDGYELTIQGCEMYLLAKDGIYISDFPRAISSALIFLGARADIMVRCPDALTVYNMRNRGSVMATMETSDTVGASVDLEQWTPVYPDYLQDLQAATVGEGCKCATTLDNDKVNGAKYEVDHVLHESFLGAVVERSLNAERHPYHQHVYPFQLVGGFTESEYIKKGDWHDTFEGRANFRYRPMEFETKVMLHCHKLTHEDQGMMALEMVRNASNICTCGDDLSNGSGDGWRNDRDRDWSNENGDGRQNDRDRNGSNEGNNNRSNGGNGGQSNPRFEAFEASGARLVSTVFSFILGLMVIKCI